MKKRFTIFFLTLAVLVGVPFAVMAKENYVTENIPGAEEIDLSKVSKERKVSELRLRETTDYVILEGNPTIREVAEKVKVKKCEACGNKFVGALIKGTDGSYSIVDPIELFVYVTNPNKDLDKKVRDDKTLFIPVVSSDDTFYDAAVKLKETGSRTFAVKDKKSGQVYLAGCTYNYTNLQTCIGCNYYYNVTCG